MAGRSTTRTGRAVLIGGLAAISLGLGLGSASGAPPRPRDARRPASPRPGVPEVRRIARIEDQGGERLLRSPLAIARDRKTGELVVSSFESGEIVVLDRSGVLVTRFGADAGLVTPLGVAVDAAGRIYVSELRTGLAKVLASGGAAEDELDLSRIAGRTVSPGRITLGDDGLIYVADLSANKVLVVGRQGELVCELGPFEQLQKSGPVTGGRILGLSAYGPAVTLFDRSGATVRAFGKHGDPSDRNVSFPTGFAIDGRGRIWVADAFQHRIKVFSLEGEFLFNFGRPQETPDGEGFFFPVDLCFGAPGELIVLEKGAERIQTFRVADLVEAGR